MLTLLNGKRKLRIWQAASSRTSLSTPPTRQVKLSLQLAHNSNPLASSSTRDTSTTSTTNMASTAIPTRIPPKTERNPARFSFLCFAFLCSIPQNTIRVFLINYGQYTHNKRTIPFTSVKDNNDYLGLNITASITSLLVVGQ